jgi:tetratricopeptide (TPR) repeat protein
MPDWSTDDILAVHVRMHQAEGELFRDVLVAGAQACGLAVTRLADKSALDDAAQRLGIARADVDTSLAALGRTADAIKEYEEVEKRAGDNSLYGRMARLGKAETQARAGQLDPAIATWKQMVSDTNSDVPQDAILMQLARAYVQQGNTAEAKKTFNEIVDKHPDSPYVAEARTELENLKG